MFSVKRLLVLLLFVATFSSAFGQTVYVTKSGKKYHTSSCSYLRSSSIPMELKDAIASGYSPCSRCNPPTAVTQKKSSADTVKTKAKTETGFPGQCQAITKAGTQCKRKAQAGSIYCWQHQPKSSTTISPNSTSSGQTIYTGPRGGKYYINSLGKKTYIRKKK